MSYELPAYLTVFARDVDALERDFAAFKVRLAKAINSNPKETHHGRG